MGLSIILLIVAIAVLFFGAEFSLDASEKVGKKLGLSPLVIGMLIIGFGTSLPEFFVGHIAGIQGKAGIAIGSLIGSNIANLLLILGVSGFLARLKLSGEGVKGQLVVHLALGAVLAYTLSQDVLNVFTSAPLIILCGVYLYMIFLDLKEDTGEKEEVENFHPGKVVLKLFAGFGMLYLGGELLVKSGTEICEAIGISEYIVSAIFIAFGTSFPELVTSVMAALKKKETDLIVGNIIGSNMFNCAFILGSLGIYSFDLDMNFTFEIIALIVSALYLVVLGFMNRVFYRLSGTLFLAGYAAVVGYWLRLF